MRRCQTIAGLAMATITTAAAALPPPGMVDEAGFRNGLRERGLDAWLDQYLAETPPIDETDHQLRIREAFLAEAGQPGMREDQRQAKVTQAAKILSDLIRQHPQHPLKPWWLYESGRDALERSDPQAFEAVLLYEMSGHARQSVLRLSEEAVNRLRETSESVTAEWKSAEAMDEADLEQARASGWLDRLQMLDGQSELSLAWGELYQALTQVGASTQNGDQLFASLLADVTQRLGWTELEQPSQTSLRCQGLLLAAVSARHLKRYDEAEGYARRVVSSIERIGDAQTRGQLGPLPLLVVLEQIRCLRDRGKQDAAIESLAQARSWAADRPDSDSALAALAFLEARIIAGPTWSVIQQGAIQLPPNVLAPLQRFADSSSTRREKLYTLLAGALNDEMNKGSVTPFQLQLLAGAAVSNALMWMGPEQRVGDEWLRAAIVAMEAMLKVPPADAAPAQMGELMFLLAKARYLTGHELEAASTLCDLAQEFPPHDRVKTAIEQAVAITQGLMSKGQQETVPAARTAFVRAARLLRQRAPDEVSSRRLQYFIGAVLEQARQWREAAAEYAAVPVDDPRRGEALLRAARCLRHLLDWAGADGRVAEADQRRMAEEALEAARQAASALATAAPDRNDRHVAVPTCLSADATLLLAGILSHPLIARYEEALDALEGFGARFDKCTETVGPALRERILALRELKRMGEARQVVERFLETEPDRAGPVLARLLEAMREESDQAADRGDEQAVRELAGETVQLADRLLAWSAQRPGQVVDDDLLTVRLWRAWSVLETNEPAGALPLFEELHAEATGDNVQDSPLKVDIELGLASGLMATGKTVEAVNLFNGLWQRVPEHSPRWWRAYVGCLQGHAALKRDPTGVLASIQQQRQLAPELGGPRWHRHLEAIEAACRAATQPADTSR